MHDLHLNAAGELEAHSSPIEMCTVLCKLWRAIYMCHQEAWRCGIYINIVLPEQLDV